MLLLLACQPDPLPDSELDADTAPQAHLRSVEALQGALLARWEGEGVLRVQGQGVDLELPATDSATVELADGEYTLWLEGSSVRLDQLVGENRLVHRKEWGLPGAMDVWGEGNLGVIAGGDHGLIEVLLVQIDPLQEVARVEGSQQIRDVKMRDGLIVASGDAPVTTRLYDEQLTLLSELPGAHNVTLGEGTLAAMHRETMSLYDVSDPANPVWLSDWDSGPPPHDATWVDDRLYVAWANGFAVLDVSDPSDPQLLWRQVLEGDFPSLHNIWPLGDAHVITSQEKVGGHLQVWELGVGEVGAWNIGDNDVHNVYADGTTAFAAWYLDGVVALDLQDPSDPVLLGHLETWQGVKPPVSDDKPVIQGAWGLWPFGEHILVGDTQRGLLVVDFFPLLVEAG